MADQVTNYQCPACTGPLRFDAKTGKLKCDYCGSSFTVREIEKLYAEKNAAAEKAKKEADQKAEREAAESVPVLAGEEAAKAEAVKEGTAKKESAKEPAVKEEAEGSVKPQGGWGSDAGKMRAYNCTSCGAELICDETTAATKCPYCGNNTIIPGQFAGTLKPDYVIPFRKEKKEAVDTLKQYYKGKMLLPGSFSKASHLEEIKGVYVPFWLFSGHVDARGFYDAKQDEVHCEGEYEITRSRHYEADREGTMSFSRIPADASSKMPDDLMDSIEPFDYSEITDFSLSYMPGYLANKYDVSSQECGRRAQERAKHSAADALYSTVQGYTSVTTRTHEEKAVSEKTEYAVFPVWLLSTKWEGQNFLFAMNGQTGKMIGNLPVSRAKQALWFLGAFIISFLIFATFLLSGDDVSSSFVIAAAFALIPAVILNTVLVSQMKPVARESRASAYAASEGIRLHVKNDRYIRTTESRVKIQNRQEPGRGIPHGGPPRGHK